MHETDVWLNGQHLANHLGGYLPFSVDLTNFLFDGKNILKVKVNNENNPVIPPGRPLEILDFNYYGGIYRDVTLINTKKIYITDPVSATKPASGGVLDHFSNVGQTTTDCIVKVHINNELNKNSQLKVRAILISKTGKKHKHESETLEVLSGSSIEIPVNFKVDNPLLWSP